MPGNRCGSDLHVEQMKVVEADESVVATDCCLNQIGQCIVKRWHPYYVV